MFELCLTIFIEQFIISGTNLHKSNILGMGNKHC